MHHTIKSKFAKTFVKIYVENPIKGKNHGEFNVFHFNGPINGLSTNLECKLMIIIHHSSKIFFFLNLDVLTLSANFWSFLLVRIFFLLLLLPNAGPNRDFLLGLDKIELGFKILL